MREINDPGFFSTETFNFPLSVSANKGAYTPHTKYNYNTAEFMLCTEFLY